MPHDLRPHPHGCACKTCRPAYPADRHAMAARFWPRAALALLLFWAFPGRWLIASAWGALLPLFSR
ncbi:hypothetical protein FHW96_002368 [Novosphingobium sp. SG751A]|uniref:hypothetical protein n=1 Tax=Novosphingobium sp. SG751A TaxID=2587000 RepID=UPI0015546F69|nr:hypothetical protein [Novosphingobium sp. SG751A]NOW46210.1 hypothetical protein [Novosphingobium sp. SG751A]